MSVISLIRYMHTKNIDLNLLRLFNEVYRAGNVSRAAERLGMTQPAASQALTRLRLLLKDPLFMRAAGGVEPTPRAHALAESVQQALQTIDDALEASAGFQPQTSRRLFRLHMSDIGEGRFLPELMKALVAEAPHVRLATQPVPHDDIAAWLDRGTIDFAFGFLPRVKSTRSQELLDDRYIVLMRREHPMREALQACRQRSAVIKWLRRMEFVAIRSHADTLRILQHEGLEERLRLTTQHFMVLPSIVRSTDLCAVMPRNIAQGFAAEWGCALFDPQFERSTFTVSLHWSHRFENDPGHQWFRQLVVRLFAERVRR